MYMEQKPFSRSVMDVGGGSLGVSLPRGLCRVYDVDTEDELPIEVDQDEGTVTFRLDDN